MKNFDEFSKTPSRSKAQFAVFQQPTASIQFLIFPFFRISDTRFGLHIVEPHVFGARAVGPGVFARDAARMTSEAFVKIQYHRHLGFNPHTRAPPWLCAPQLPYLAVTR